MILDSRYLQKLKSTSETDILDVVKIIRNEGQAEYLPDLINLLATTQHSSVKHAIENLFYDLHDQSAAAAIINLIAQTTDEKIKQILVSTCWQSRLNFKNDIQIFVDLVLFDSYLIAIEAFSVIENIFDDLTSDNRKKIAIFVKSKMSNIEQEKKALIAELLHLLEQ